MEQTPAHDNYNPDILKIMRADFTRVVEVGVSTGALAKAYRSINPHCHYTGIEIDPEYAKKASNYCSNMVLGNIEQLTDEVFTTLFPSDCWIFGDVLEHLYDPWQVLQKIRSRIHPTTEIIACLPNAQHWSMQATLCSGLLRYQESGLLDKTHIRWFTRTTIIELFDNAGYKIIEGIPRIFNKPSQTIIDSIRAMALAIGTDPQLAEEDALPLQWVIKAVPK